MKIPRTREQIQAALESNAIVAGALREALARCSHAARRRTIEDRIGALWAERAALQAEIVELERLESLTTELAPRGLRIALPGEPGWYFQSSAFGSVWVTETGPEGVP